MSVLRIVRKTMRLTCPACEKPMTALTRPPKLKHKSKGETLAVNYCVCNHCGRRGIAQTTVKLVEDFFQEDWVKQGS